MKRVGLGMLAAIVIASVSVPVSAAGVTVGRFYMEIAQAKHLGAADPAAAEASLRQAGLNLPTLRLDTDLTQGQMTTIAGALGISVTTQKPSQAISETQMSAFMNGFGRQIGGSSVTPYTTNGDNGKGLKKGHHKSSSEPL